MKKSIISIAIQNHLETLRQCGGYYECRKDKSGKRLGPLVGYAGTYKVITRPTMQDLPDKKLQYVGDIYANFAMAEIHPQVLRRFAKILWLKLGNWINRNAVDCFVGAPIGGYSLSDALGFASGANVIKAEKKVTALATETSREKSKLVFARHSIMLGMKYVIVEDVCNNFSTTQELSELIESEGGKVVAIVCFLNRSLTIDDHYCIRYDHVVPVISLVRKPINEWRQDDPAVAEDIAKGNVVLKPKNEWPRLMEAMSANAK